MRILQVNKYVYRKGGAEGYLLDLADLQRTAGHEVALWGMQSVENEPRLPLADTFPTFIELDPPPGGPAALAAAARMVWSPQSRRGLASAIDKFRPDIIHAHNIYHQLSPSILAAARRAGVPVVMTLHDYKLACPSYQMLDHGRPCAACVGHSTLPAVRRRCKSGSLGGSSLLALESGIHRLTNAYDSIAALISPSRFLADVMRRAGVPDHRLHVVPHFVLVDERGRPRTPRAGGVVFAGRLSHEKGVDTLVRAAAQTPELTVHIAGDGPERSMLEALAATYGANNVRFHGRLAKEELLDLVATTAAMVVPSRWYENQPMTILEAYAVGVPTIVTSMGGMPELVDDGVDGFIVPPDDPAALAAAMIKLAGDLDRATAMGRAGQEKLLGTHSQDAHLKAVQDIYDAVIGRSIRRRS